MFVVLPGLRTTLISTEYSQLSTPPLVPDITGTGTTTPEDSPPVFSRRPGPAVRTTMRATRRGTRKSSDGLLK